MTSLAEILSKHFRKLHTILFKLLRILKFPPVSLQIHASYKDIQYSVTNAGRGSYLFPGSLSFNSMQSVCLYEHQLCFILAYPEILSCGEESQLHLTRRSLGKEIRQLQVVVQSCVPGLHPTAADKMVRWVYA